MVVTTSPSVESVFLCVEARLCDVVKRDGFTCRSRRFVAVESTKERAIDGYSNHHREPGVVFRVLPGFFEAHEAFFTPNGSWRLSAKHVPAEHLVCLQESSADAETSTGAR